MAGWCASLTKPERVFWFIITLAAIAVLIYEWVLVICDFVNFPFRSRIIYDDRDYLELPSVLLCPRDPINYTVAGRTPILSNTNLLRYIQQMAYPSAISPLSSAALDPSQIGDLSTLQRQWDQFYQQPQYYNDKWRAYLDLHWQCEGIVKRCQVGEGYNMTNTECCRMAKPLTLPDGPCLQFQMPYQYVPSYLGGFHIDLEVKSVDVPSAVSTFQGIDVYIGSSVQKPMYPTLRLQRDQLYNIKIKPQKFMMANVKKCEKRMEEYYGNAAPSVNATMNCTAKIVWSQCNCYPMFKLQTDNREQEKICTFDQIRTCANNTLRIMHENRNATGVYNQNYQQICGYIYPPCEWMKYDTVLDQSKDSEVNAYNFATKLTFFYDDFQVETIDRFWAPNFHEVIMQMGGALVFWFVVVHILIYIVEGFKMLCCWSSNGFTRMKNKIDDAEMNGPPMKGHPPPIITHHLSNDIPPPRTHLEPLPPIPIMESTHETQTAMS